MLYLLHSCFPQAVRTASGLGGSPTSLRLAHAYVRTLIPYHKLCRPTKGLGSRPHPEETLGPPQVLCTECWAAC